MSTHPHTEAAREDARQADGKFGHQHHSESSITLGLAPQSCPRPEPAVGRHSEARRGLTTLVDSTAEDQGTDGVFHTTRIHMAGQPHVRARTGAIKALFMDGRDHAEFREQMIERAQKREKVTMLRASDNGDVEVQEAFLSIGSTGEAMYLEKGSRTKGYRLNPDTLLTVIPGYGKTEKMTQTYNDVAAAVPATQKITLDDLAALPDGDDDSADRESVAAVYLTNHPGFAPAGDFATDGCMFLATDAQDSGDPQNPIINGYFWAPGDSGLFSETSSMYARDLMNQGGQLTGYQPGTLSVSQAYELPSDRSEAYAAAAGWR